MTDCLIVGGGVVGLSLAYELARQEMHVCVIDQSEPGREASWAGAGILPPVVGLTCARCLCASSVSDSEGLVSASCLTVRASIGGKGTGT